MGAVEPKQHDRHEQSDVDQRKGEPRILVPDRLAEGDTVVMLFPHSQRGLGLQTAPAEMACDMDWAATHA